MKVNNMTGKTIIKLIPNVHGISIYVKIYTFFFFSNAKAMLHVRDLFCSISEIRTRMNGLKVLPSGKLQNTFIPSTMRQSLK